MNRYERRLPHWDVIGRPLFVTFRLHGSLPENRVFPPARLTTGEAFARMDRLLDRAVSGPMYLARPEIASMVLEALHEGQTRFHRYEIHSFAIMPNHVHLLVTSHVDMRRWLGSLKGFTGHEANRLLGRRGEPFWRDESYDRVVRTELEFRRICAYIENNPAKAGLAETADSFPWSSAYQAPPGKAAAAQKG